MSNDTKTDTKPDQDAIAAAAAAAKPKGDEDGGGDKGDSTGRRKAPKSLRKGSEVTLWLPKQPSGHAKLDAKVENVHDDGSIDVKPLAEGYTTRFGIRQMGDPREQAVGFTRKD